MGTDSGGGNGQTGKPAPFEFTLSDPGAIASHFFSKDKTGEVYGTMHYMSTVEDWVFKRLGEKDGRVHEQVQVRLQRLDAVIAQYREQIPPDNSSFLQILSWLSIDQCMYTIEYLHECQMAFFQQLIEHCKALQYDDMTAQITYKRIMTLQRSRLLDRVLGSDNTEFVNRILLK